MEIIKTLDDKIKIDNKEYFGQGLQDAYVFIGKKFGDDRGWFWSPYINPENEKTEKKLFGKVEQVNESKSKKGSLRGLHYQLEPFCQSKIVRVTKGAAIDVIADIRTDSPTFGKWFGILLTPENNKLLLVPKGFAHGFLALENDTTFEYLVDDVWNKSLEAGIPWDDKTINIDWEIMFEQYGIKKEELELSPKDKEHSSLKDKIFNNEIQFTISSSKFNKEDENNSNLKRLEEIISKQKELIEKLNSKLYYNEEIMKEIKETVSNYDINSLELIDTYKMIENNPYIKEYNHYNNDNNIQKMTLKYTIDQKNGDE